MTALVETSRQILPDAIYSVDQAAALTSFHPDVIRRKLRAGIIAGKRKGGGAYRIRGSELLKLATFAALFFATVYQGIRLFCIGGSIS